MVMGAAVPFAQFHPKAIISRRQEAEPTGDVWPADGRGAGRALTSTTVSRCSLLSQRRLRMMPLKSLQHTGDRSLRGLV